MSKFILIIDDELASLELAQRGLEQAGHMVFTASTGWKARELIDAAHFDVVITDIFMPEMDGLEVIRYICETGRTTPIIAMSGGNFLPVAASLGADLVLAKPILPSELQRAVAQVTVNPSRSLLRSAKERIRGISTDGAAAKPHRGSLQ